MISVGKTRELDANNQNVTAETKQSEPIVINGKVGLAAVEVSCETMTTVEKASAVQNVETEGKHKMTGNGTARFSNCTVNKPAKCDVMEPIEANANFEGAEKLGAAENEMGVEFRGAGAEETFTSVTFQEPECALKNQTYKVKGSAIGTSGPTTSSSQTNKYSGATIVFTPSNGMQNLKLGTNSATVTFIATPRGAENGPPIATTTTA